MIFLRSPAARARRAPFLALLAFLVALVWLTPGDARAYAWMIRHGYTACAQCHADPSGGGVLTPYGRAQGEISLRQQWGRDPDAEPGKVADFMFGAFKLPDPLLLQGDVRSLLLQVVPSKGEAPPARVILMQADLAGQVKAGRFRVNGSLGYVHEGALAASLTKGENDRVISRVHWLGLDLGEDNPVLLRVGRMHLPFGVRSLEHTLWTRKETRSDINDAQQYGIAASYNSGKVRGEAMLILGNFLMSPDNFRSRGYSAYAEYALAETAAIGLSSMITYSARDPQLIAEAVRHSHGIFARYAPEKRFVLTTEFDLLHTSSPTPGQVSFGAVGHAQIDMEPVQGIHFGLTLEARQRSFDRERASKGVWASAWWFFAPHADLRLDAIFQSVSIPDSPTSVGATSLLAQLHSYL